MSAKQLLQRVLIIGAVTGSTLGIAGNASAGSIPKYVEDELVRICTAIKEDDRLALHQAVKASGIKYRVLAEKLQCNGQDMLTFAANHNAAAAQTMLASRLNLSTRTLTAKN